MDKKRDPDQNKFKKAWKMLSSRLASVSLGQVNFQSLCRVSLQKLGDYGLLGDVGEIVFS